MQQSVNEEAVAYEPSSTRTYDDLFPALPESVIPIQNVNNSIGQWNNKMRVGSSVVTQVFRVPIEERKLDHNDKFGEGEAMPTCLSIMKDTGAHIEISSSKDQSLTFLVTGKQNEVLEARRKILTHFQTQASKQLPIPKEHHRWVLGKLGAKLKELEKVTATKINVPPIGDPSEVITITGTKEGIEKAEHEIRICSDEQSKKAFERITIPRIYHPFIFGPNNETLSSIMAETGARVNIPPPSAQKDEISIAGEKEGVFAAKRKVEAIYWEMEKKCTTVSVEVPKTQHKYIIGPRGSTIQEILLLTNVSVEMPPLDSSTGTITLRGPHDKLGLALSKVYEKANSVRTLYVDAPSWIHKYIIGKKGANIKRITQDLPKVHVEFNDKENRIKIEGPPEEVEKAQEELDKVSKDYVANLTFVKISVDSKYHKHIIGKSGANVNRIKEETNVAINIDDSSNFIHIEGSKEGVAQAKQELEDMVEKMENEKEKDVIIDHRHYKNIIGSKGESIKEIRDKFNQVQINFPGQGDKRDVVKIRGPKEDVDKCHKHLQKLVKELDEASYHIEVPIFKQFHKYIIGKGGANIKKIRDETQTRIDLPAEGDKSDAITITGKKEKVEEARERIQKIQQELANIVSDEITIPPKFYNSLIGTGGKLIHSIMEECGGVTIKFPTAESKSDKVTIRGPKEDVERAKAQLLELTTERQLSSFTAEVRAKAQHHKFLIGKNGANIKKIRDSTGARIVFPTDKDEDKEAITIIGKKESVEKAKAEMEAYIKEIDNIIESDMSVSPKHHKHFVARRGEVLHRITDECGGVMISFPRSGVQSDRVVLKGAKDCIEAAKTRILEIVQDLESMVTMECIIPQKHHRTVMGSKGLKVQGITSEFDVQIKFPDRDLQQQQQQQLPPMEDGFPADHVNGVASIEPEVVAAAAAATAAAAAAAADDSIKPCDIIKITGKEINCQKAKQALLDLVPITIEVDVPFEMHRSIIGQKGRDVKDLMDRYDVHIVLSPADQHLDIIKITGSVTNVQDAKLAIEEKCKQFEADKVERQLRSFELKIEVNPDYHPKIIGRKGTVITKIRSDHNVQINFPRKGDPEEHIITITGYEENAFAAKEDIMKIVNELNDMVKEEIMLDSRVHSRLIGARGRNIRKIMEEYKVDIKFPRSDDPDPNVVTISGAEEHVAEVKDHLLNLEEEYLQDVTEAQLRESYRPLFSREEDNGQRSGDHRGGGRPPGNGFVVQGGPWEQERAAAPNTASVEEFPTFGGGPSIDNTVHASPVAGPWGPRR